MFRSFVNLPQWDQTSLDNHRTRNAIEFPKIYQHAVLSLGERKVIVYGVLCSVLACCSLQSDQRVSCHLTVTSTSHALIHSPPCIPLHLVQDKKTFYSVPVQLWKCYRPNEELNDLYSLPYIVRLIKSRRRWARNVARMVERRNVYRVLVGKPEGDRPLGRPRCRWEYNCIVTCLGWFVASFKLSCV